MVDNYETDDYVVRSKGYHHNSHLMEHNSHITALRPTLQNKSQNLCTERLIQRVYSDDKKRKIKKSRETSRISGTVKWFNAKNGYGFITRNDTNEDVFIHFSGILKKNPRHSMKSLGDGEAVEFNIIAVNVTGPRGNYVKGNPYVSYIPIRKLDVFAAGDTGIILPMRRNNLSPPDYGNSRIPRWTSMYRNLNF